jgi:hypothetical protein
MTKILLFIFFAFALFAPSAFGQKKKVPSKALSSGVYKTIQSGKDTIKFVRLDALTKSAIVEGVTTDWEKDGTTYFSLNLKRGQRLNITPDADDISIETMICGQPLDAVQSGAYKLKATETCSYDIAARSVAPGKKYVLTLKME